MIRQGVLEDPDVDAIFGLHISQGDAVGQASYRPRGAMASAQSFEIRIRGRQTHGAEAALVADPSLAREILGWSAQHSGLCNILQTAWSWMERR